MNVENLISILDNKDPLDEKAVAQIALLLEKYPYFQLGHMLLLRAHQKFDKEMFEKQLKISGCFISDKRKLFKFLNPIEIPDFAEIPSKETSTETIKERKSEKVERKVLTEEKTPVKLPITEKKEVNSIGITKIEAELKEKSEKQNLSEEFESDIKESVVKKKVDLPEEEIERIADENSQVKHHKIITDFFHGTENPQLEKKVIETEKKEERIVSDRLKSIIEKPLKKEIVEKPIKDEIVQPKIIKEEIKKEPLITNIEKTVEKEEPKVEEKIISEKKEVPEKRNIIETIKAQETVQPKTKIIEIKKEPEIKEEPQTLVKKESGDDAMNNIFSKIRQIKKELNLNSESTPETIDIEIEEKRNLLKKTPQPEEKREKVGGRIIKESYIGFTDEPTSEEEDTDKNKEEENKIKQSELTAKELFRQRLREKEKSFSDTEKKDDSNENLNYSKSPISKIVDIVNEETAITPSDKEKITEQKKDEPIKIEKEVGNETIPPLSKKSGSESAADALLRRIAEKKKRLREEEQLEEQRKKEEKKRELEAVNEYVKGKKIEETVEESSTEKTKEEFTEAEEKTEITTSMEITSEDENVEDDKEENNAELISGTKEKKANKLIDSFIEKAESLERIGKKESSLTGDISITSTIESEEILTETYADLLIQQKNYKKAIDVYNKLILKFPEKKTYFAIQIKKVESLIK